MDGLVRIFFKMTQAGLQAGAAVLVVLACRQIFLKKQPRNFCCMLWMLVFLRFLCPVTWNVALPVPQAWSQRMEAWREDWQVRQQDFWAQAAAEGRSGDAGRASELQDGKEEAGSSYRSREADAAESGSDMAEAGMKSIKTGGAAAEAGMKSAKTGGAVADAGRKSEENAADAGSKPEENAADAAIASDGEQSASGAGNADLQAKADGIAAARDGRTDDTVTGSGAGGERELRAGDEGGLRIIRAWFSQNVSKRLLMRCMTVLWLLGAAALLTAAAVQYLGLKRRLRYAVKETFCGQRVWVTDQIASPFVMGIFRPEIYLPAGLSEREKYHIVTHERAHIQRRDYLFKQFCYLGTVCQWMNPFAWIAFHFYNQDMEMACDERALKGVEKKERLDYSRTLLMTAVRDSGLQLPVFFGESNAKRRVENILQKKKRTIAGGCLAAVLICGLAVLLFVGNGEKDDGVSAASGQPESANGQEEENENAAVGQKDAAQDGQEPSAASASGQSFSAGKMEAYPFVEDGQLKVMLYNFTGWSHMYVNQADFRVEQKRGERWEVVEPDLSVNRITSEPKLFRVEASGELSGLLAQYETELEDGDYRLVLYCQDAPVEDENAAPEELYVPFSWKDEAPVKDESMQEEVEAASQRYQETDFPGRASFVYSQEASTREEEIQRLAQEYETIGASDRALLKLYEEKLKQMEMRMEEAKPQVREAYSDFSGELRQEMRELEAAMENLKDARAAEEDMAQNRLEYEEELQQVQGEISYIEKREELEDALLREIEKAEGEEKQSLIDAYNNKAEFMQQLRENKFRLQQEVHRLNQEIKKSRMQEWAGYDLVEKQKQELAGLPEAFSAEEAEGYGIPVIRADGDDGGVRDGLYHFWMQTELEDAFSEAADVEALKNGETGQDGETDSQMLYSRVKTMTYTFGEETEEGDLILTSVTAWNGGYLILVDRSRDRQRNSDTEEFSVYCYDHLHWLTESGRSLEVVTASDEQTLTYQQWEENLLSSQLNGAVDRVDVALFLKRE